MSFKDSARRGMAKKQQLLIFAGRTQRNDGINWRELNTVDLKAALAVAGQKGVTISFTPAAGGAGVMVKVYQGEYAASEFAGNIEGVNELLGIIVDTYQSTSEDARLAMGGSGQIRENAAD